MNKVRKFFNEDKGVTDGECNYTNILGLALLLKRNGITAIRANKYEDFERLISNEESKENALAKKIIDSTLIYIGWLDDRTENMKNMTPKKIYNIVGNDTEEYKWTLNYFLKQSIEISKYDEKDIIEEITRPINDYAIDEYNDGCDLMNEDISKLMVSVLNIEKGKKIAVLDLDYYGEDYNNNGIIESQIILQTENSNIDSYYGTIKKLNREIREYAINEETNHISKNLFEKEITELYDYILVYPEILGGNRAYFFNLKKSIFSGLDINKYNSNISASSIMALKVLNALNKNGKGIIAFPQASLSNISERRIRQMLIEDNYIDKVIKVGDCYLVVLKKNKKERTIQFVNLDSFVLSKRYNCTFNICDSIDMRKAMQEFNNNSVIVHKEKIIDNCYSLNPDIYMKPINIKSAVKLETVLNRIFRGYQASKEEVRTMKVQDSKEANYKLLEIGNISDNGEISASLTLIDSAKIGRSFDRYLLKDGDIVITARGEKIKIAYVKLEENERIIANGSINVIRVNKDKMNSRYLKMFLDSPKGKQTLENIKIGREKTPSLNTGDLKRIEIPCPPLTEQHAVVKEYEKIEEKINNLKKELNDINNNF